MARVAGILALFCLCSVMGIIAKVQIFLEHVCVWLLTGYALGEVCVCSIGDVRGREGQFAV